VLSDSPDAMVTLHVRQGSEVPLHCVVCLRLNDGAGGEINLEAELEGEVFGPLKVRRLFLVRRTESPKGKRATRSPAAYG